MKASEIVKHLQRYLPVFTDAFSVDLTGTATVSGTTITVSAAAHGLQVGDMVVVRAGLTRNLLSA